MVQFCDFRAFSSISCAVPSKPKIECPRATICPSNPFLIADALLLAIRVYVS